MESDEINLESECLRVMGYFRDSGSTLEEQSLHLAVTSDGRHWKALNGNRGVFRLSTIGGNRVRDPYIVKKPDGKYLMIATDWTLYKSPVQPGNHRLYDGTKSDVSFWNYVTDNYWDVNTSCLIFADSDDMTSWTNERQIQMVSDADKKAFREKNGNYQFCWAPEIIHDGGKVIFTDPLTKAEYRYGVIWSGQGETNGSTSISYNPVTGIYETTCGHGTSYRRTFVNYTNDFETFSGPQVYFNPSNSNIDASVCSDEGAFSTDGTAEYHIFYKDEFNIAEEGIVKASSGMYTLCQNHSDSLLPNSFNRNRVYSQNHLGNSITASTGPYNQGEGMFCFRPYASRKLWYLVLDAHDAHQEKVFALYETNDFRTWKVNDDTSWPEGDIRHGASVKVTREEMIKLIETYGI